MSTVVVRLQLYRYRCPERQDWEEQWVVAPSFEDAVVLIAETGAMVAVLPDDDRAWVEIDHFVKGLGVDPSTPSGSALFRRLYLETVDFTKDRTFSFEHRPDCAGNKRPSTWGPVSPPVFRDEEVEVVTHQAWFGLDDGERRRRLEEARHPHG